MIELASFNPNVPTRIDAQRRGLLAKVHLASKSLGMVEDDYRQLLQRTTGEASAKDCTIGQLEDVVDEFERLGFSARVRTRPAVPRRAQNAVAGKARAMWISLYQLGAINDPSESALEAFGKRQLGVDRLQWADQTQGFRLIEALKAMAERHGWRQAVPSRLSGPTRIAWLKNGLVEAQLAKLVAVGAGPIGPIAGDRSQWTIEQLESAGAELGLLLREVAPAV